MNNKKLIIIGTGEIASNAYEYFKHDSEYEIVAFSENNEFIKKQSFKDLPIIPLEEIENYYNKSSYDIFVALGDGQLNRQRTKIYKYLKNKGYNFANYISSKAFVWKNVEIGENCFILENNTIQPFVKIGNNVTLWSGNHIGHSSVIKDNCFITSHVVISGMCEIGENCFIGVNSCMAANIKISPDCYIAMGSVINKNTIENNIYSGNPAKKMAITAKEYFGVNEDL